jgi:acyl transferase domain-containing protein
LKRLVGEEIRLAPERIGSSDSFESFGIDSVVINRLNAGLESALGALPKTLFYEYETIAGLSKFLVKEVGEPLAALLGTSGIPAEQIAASLPGAGEPSARSVRVPRARDAHPSEPIAIIGMHGYYPHAASLEDYWEYLAQGRDVIDVVPRDRWNHDELFDPDPAAAANGKAYCKWGGFLDDYDKFDPRFFDLSPEEARAIDPQERLFLQSVWSAIEDAGYTRANLKTRFAKGRGADVGVFVGVTTNSYHLWAPEERSRGNVVSPATMPWSIANRVSYFFDFHGPSLPVDTACSSSLVALHLACESLRRRECQVAVAGGVNLYLHPSKYQSLCQARMLAHDGKCHSYGAGTGFVPGEAIGSVVVKPLRQALEDRDRIHAVVLASASDHGGRSNGYSAPNPSSQSALISRALEQAGIHPESIGYVEGHGTGTALGDGVEVVALTQAFRRQTTRKAFCPIGSVKANIGHAESAAGMASLAKVILQLQHRQVVPSIHCDEANPNIDFAESPFYLQRELCDWTPSAHPPRALINSFGAGGVSACVVVEGHAQQDPLTETAAGPYVIPLSARSEDRLHESVSRLLAHLHRSPHVDLAGLSYTLQAGREAMEERLALVVSNVRELIGRLHEWKRGEPAAGVHRGSVAARGSGPRPAINTLTEIDHDRAEELASMWVAGGAVDWGSLYSSTRPRPITLPTYPFARERYWISDARPPEPRTSPVTRLHPLISYNSSTLTEVSFSSSVSDTEFYAVDHTINGLKILPAAAFVEIACVAGTLACARRIHKIRDVVWARPVNLSAGAQTLRTVLKAIGGGAEYVTSSVGDDGEVVWHSEGKLIVGNGAAQVAETGRRVAIRALKAQGRCESGGDVYRTFSTYGINYGPSFRTIQEAYVGEAFVLSRLTLADCVTDEWDRYLLHPSMIDGALQTVAGLVRNAELATPCIPFALDELEIVGPVPQTCYAYAERIDSERQQSAGIWRFNVQLLNESGDVLVRLTHLHVRPLGAAPATRPVAAAEADGRLLSLAGEGVG